MKRKINVGHISQCCCKNQNYLSGSTNEQAISRLEAAVSNEAHSKPPLKFCRSKFTKKLSQTAAILCIKPTAFEDSDQIYYEVRQKKELPYSGSPGLFFQFAYASITWIRL
jgi:hypothetical protein